jgi:low temperature requirement protein LtrA
MPIVGGIVIGAVSDALVLEHWADPVSPALVLTLCGGNVLFLMGLSAFKRLSSPLKAAPLSHGVASVVFVLIGIWGWFAHPGALVLAGWGVAILALAGVWEWVSFHGGWKERFHALIGREAV